MQAGCRHPPSTHPGPHHPDPDPRATALIMAQGRFLPVPWGGELVVQVMTLWVVAFYLLGCFVVPIALDLLDLERDDLSSRGQVGAPAVAEAVMWMRM